MDRVGKLKCFRRGSCMWPIPAMSTCMRHRLNRLVRLVTLDSTGGGFPPTQTASEMGRVVIEFWLQMFRTGLTVQTSA